MVRPIVLLFQEFATLAATPTTPDLNCVIVGPAYAIQDYLTDKVNIEVSEYGTLQAGIGYVPPTAFVAAITLAAPPGLPAGGWVDPDSVKVYFDDVRVQMATAADGAVTTNDNLMTSASATFGVAGVQPGDVLFIDDPTTTTPSIVVTVLERVGETGVRVSRNFTGTNTGLNYRIERRLVNQLVDSAFVVTPTFRQSNEIQILGGATLVVGTTPRTVMYARVYVASRMFRTDMQALDSVTSTAEIQSKIGRIDSRNPLAGAVFVAKQNAGQAPVQFYGVASDDLIGYNLAKDALSSDDSIYAVVPLTADINVAAAFKTEHDTLADPNAALNNGVPQKLRVVIGSGELTTTKTIVDQNTDATTEQLTGALPGGGVKTITLASLTARTSLLKPGDKLVLSASENTASLDGTYTIAHINSETTVEVNEATEAVAVTSIEGVNYTVTRPSTGATMVALVDNRAARTHNAVVYTSRAAGITPGARTITLNDVGTTPGGIHSITETPGVSTIIDLDLTAASITAAQLVAAINTGVGVTNSFSGSVNIIASTSSGATIQNTALTGPLSGGTPGVDDITTSALDAVYIKLFDPNATFITAGVLAGDIIEIPNNPNGIFSTSTKQFVVDQVLSEERLQIANVVAGAYTNNTSTVENELPHIENRLGLGPTTLGDVLQGTIRYRVIRNLSKDQQITQLVTNAQSLNSRRAILVWPDVVTVSGLVDGSKTPNSDGTAAAADPQPGYYLSAVVGGMTAGLPSHQGFSRLGCAGIGVIAHASDYFSEKQLTDLSDGGWYVFAQNAPTALPYSIHQLTTDPSTLQSGEYSIVKNFDFVSLFYLGILEPFLGVWNVNNDTLGFMRQALNTGTENLKLRRIAKIGAPLNSASITSLAVSTASADRVEIYVEVDLPKPLNVIGLHLVA